MVFGKSLGGDQGRGEEADVEYPIGNNGCYQCECESHAHEEESTRRFKVSTDQGNFADQINYGRLFEGWPWCSSE